MKTSSSAARLLAATAASLFLAIGFAAAADEPAAGTETKPAIARGMTADVIRKLIGEPLEIRSFDRDGIQAESWIYRRKMGSHVTDEAVLTELVPAFVGPGYGDKNNTDLIDVPAYRLKRTTSTQVTAMLMLDGVLIEARQWVEQEVDYEG